MSAAPATDIDTDAAERQRKPMSVTTKAVGDDSDRVIRFVVSDGTEDRDGDIVDPGGADLTWFLRQGSILWGHDAKSPSIGKPIAAFTDNGKIVVDAKFKDPAHFSEGDMWAAFADHVYQSVKQGFDGSGSIGFLPREVEKRPNGGYRFTKWEMLEFSVLPVGSNTNAGPQIKSFEEWKKERATDEAAKKGEDDDTLNYWRGTFALLKGGLDIGAVQELDRDEVTKAGRVLSERNYNLLDEAASDIEGGATKIRELLDTATVDDEKSGRFRHVSKSALAGKAITKQLDGDTWEGVWDARQVIYIRSEIVWDLLWLDSFDDEAAEEIADQFDKIAALASGASAALRNQGGDPEAADEGSATTKTTITKTPGAPRRKSATEPKHVDVLEFDLSVEDDGQAFEIDFDLDQPAQGAEQ